MKREPPQIRWRAVIAGGAATLFLAFTLSLVAALAGSLLLVGLAVWIGIAVGGAAAGRLAGRAGLLHGGLVAALWILASGIAAPPGSGATDVLGDTLRTVVLDVASLAVGAAAGWLGSRSAGGD
ncbi:MAG: hypothetical protein KGN00_02080 [Chloroflexota bacterium]|nr:hypothetical protein [Chloroflexota bacterium]